MDNSPIILIDCYGVFYRSFYAFSNNPLTNSKGQETAVIYGFFSSLYKILAERSHSKLICILDSKGKTFRHELYKEYKAHRPPMPNSLAIQIDAIIEVLNHLGIPTVKVPTLEADDIIAYYATRPKIGTIEIFTHDKDLMQLVNDYVKVIQLNHKQQGYIEYDEVQVKEMYGVTPNRIVDYLALVGDHSDNIPGVAGVGKKTAIKLIEEYGSLKEIYAVIGDIPPRYAKKLQASRENAFLSYSLIDLQDHFNTIIKDKEKEIPVLDTISYQPCDTMAVREVWKEYECKSLLEKYGFNTQFSQSPDGNSPVTIYELINSKNPRKIKNGSAIRSTKDVKTLSTTELTPFKRNDVLINDWATIAKKVTQAGEMVFDFETTSVVPIDVEIVAVVIVLPGEKSFYFSLIHSNNNQDNVDENSLSYNYEREWLTTFKTVLEDEQIKKIGHNLKFEYSILQSKGIQLNGIGHDTMIYEYMVDPDRNAFKLEDLVEKYLQVAKSSYKEMSKGYADIFAIPTEVLKQYTYEDGECTYRIYQEQKKRLLNSKAEVLFRELELPLLKVLAKMELTGVLINPKYLKKIEDLLTQSLDFLEKEIYHLAGEEFNINSTKKLQEILFEKLGINPIKKTKTGFSTDSFVLERLSYAHPIADSLVQYRKTTKLLSTYVFALPELIHPVTKRVHTSYNQSVAATGRLSSTNPNLQNIPVGDGSQGIRHAFIAPPGENIVKIDYSQVELRVVAYLSKDPRLIHAYENDEDIHRLTAHLIFNKPIEKISSEERNIAKTINFSVIYGISPFSLSEDLRITREEAKFFIDSYFKSYVGVHNYQEQILEDARKNGWIETYYGRKRYVREINASNFNYRTRAERIAFNTVIQGTASDIIKKAMVNIDNKVSKKHSSIKMIMQVHDELVFYIKEDLTETLIPILEKEFTSIKPFDKILTVNTKVSKHWS